MKTHLLKPFIFLLAIAWGCGQKTNEHEGHHNMEDMAEDNGNTTLYNEVMKVHDEVMPKMNDLHKLKEELKNKIASPGLDEASKKDLEATIAKLDSAGNSMMVWMRSFNPPNDSLGNEALREYLETEIEKVNKVKDNVLEALEAGKAKAGN